MRGKEAFVRFAVFPSGNTLEMRQGHKFKKTFRGNITGQYEQSLLNIAKIRLYCSGDTLVPLYLQALEMRTLKILAITNYCEKPKQQLNHSGVARHSWGVIRWRTWVSNLAGSHHEQFRTIHFCWLQTFSLSSSPSLFSFSFMHMLISIHNGMTHFCGETYKPSLPPFSSSSRTNRLAAELYQLQGAQTPFCCVFILCLPDICSHYAHSRRKGQNLILEALNNFKWLLCKIQNGLSGAFSSDHLSRVTLSMTGSVMRSWLSWHNLNMYLGFDNVVHMRCNISIGTVYTYLFSCRGFWNNILFIVGLLSWCGVQRNESILCSLLKQTVKE